MLSYAAGARTLGRHASVLSRRITALEASLGIRLLERSTRRVATTEAGALYYEKIRQAMRLIRDAEDEARARAAEPAGLLRLTLPTTFGRRWVAPLLPNFLNQHPEVQIEATFNDRYADLIADEYDLALRIGHLADSALVSRKLAPTRRVLCAAPSYLRANTPLRRPNDLRRVNCLTFTPMSTHPVWHFAQQGRTQAVRVAGRMASDDIESLIAIALAGCGVLLAADWLVTQELRDGRLVEMLPDWEACGEHGVFPLRPSRPHAPAKVRAFGNWLSARSAVPPWQLSWQRANPVTLNMARKDLLRQISFGRVRRCSFN